MASREEISTLSLLRGFWKERPFAIKWEEDSAGLDSAFKGGSGSVLMRWRVETWGMMSQPVQTSSTAWSQAVLRVFPACLVKAASIQNCVVPLLYQNKGWHTAGFGDYMKKKGFQGVSHSCGNSLVSFYCVFLFFEGSWKAFKTFWGLERSPWFYLSGEQMLRFTRRRGKAGAQRQLNYDLWKGHFQFRFRGWQRAQVQVVRALTVAQLLFLCRIWSNSLCKRKPNLFYRMAALAL